MSYLSSEQLLDALRWSNSSDTGLSSEAMLCAATTGEPNSWGQFSYPRDPADLGRCLRLCARMPWVFDRAEPVLRSKGGPAWGALLDHWQQLSELMDQEVGIDWSKGRRAEATYGLMQRILYGAKS